MGTKSAAKSRYLYEINEKEEFKKTEYYAVFDSKPFSEGSYKICYKGTVKNKDGQTSVPDLFPNEECVVKVYKKYEDYDGSEFYYDLKNYFYSKNISLTFNSENQNNKKIPKMNHVNVYASALDKYATYNLFDFIPFRDDDQMKKIKKDEWILIEAYIDGKYEKFINNECLCNDNTDNTVSYFMHWNWIYSKGKKLICDIQGVKKINEYELTDPAVQSIDKEYGESDLGPDSLIKFIYSHKHNEFCKDLPWPNEEEVKKVKKLRIIYNDTLQKQLYQEFLDSFFNKDTDSNSFLIYIIIGIILVMILIPIIIRKNCKAKKRKDLEKGEMLENIDYFKN